MLALKAIFLLHLVNVLQAILQLCVQTVSLVIEDRGHMSAQNAQILW